MTRSKRWLVSIVFLTIAWLIAVDRSPAGSLRVGIASTAHAQIAVTSARIGCLDIQKAGNLTSIVAGACNNKMSCTYKAPTEDEYKRLGVHAATRSFCTQGMEITYSCAHGASQTVQVAGDAWNHPPAQLYCAAPPPPGPPKGIQVTKARIGCLDIQTTGNLTSLVAVACNNKSTCSYKAPTEDAYRSAGVKAATRTFCTQGMEITYRCGTSAEQIVSVPGDAWNHPPAELRCTDPNPATYRTKNGYSFINSDKFQTMVGGYNWDDMKELYGKCKVNVDVFGFCEIPDPLLAIYIPVLNASLQSGQCFGFSLSSLRFYNGTRSLRDFPEVSSGNDIWHLKGVEFSNGQNVSPNLSHFIHLQHALQTSAQAIHYYIEKGVGSHTYQGLQQEVTNAISTGGGILCMHNGNDGHCIVPYAVMPIAGGGFTIETYNPNAPYSSSESSDSALAQSRITVRTNNTYQLGDGSEYSGGLTGIIVFPYGMFNDPSPPLGLGVLDIIFGGTSGTGIRTTQITDATGHKLLMADGSWNIDPKTRIPNGVRLPVFGKSKPGTMIVALPRTGSYSYAIENNGSGKYQLNLVARDFGIQLQDVPARSGEKETVTFSPTEAHFGFNSTAAAKPFNVRVLARHADKSVRVAQVSGVSQANVAAELGFDAKREVFTYLHAGAPGKISVKLGYSLDKTNTEVNLAQVDVKHGDTLTFQPNWKDLKNANRGTLQVKAAGGAIQSRVLK